MAGGFCLGLAAVPGSKDLVAATDPPGVARIEGDESARARRPAHLLLARWRVVRPRSDSLRSLFASWPTGTNPGLTFSWSNNVATQLQLPMALEATLGLAALENGDFVLSTPPLAS